MCYISGTGTFKPKIKKPLIFWEMNFLASYLSYIWKMELSSPKINIFPEMELSISRLKKFLYFF